MEHWRYRNEYVSKVKASEQVIIYGAGKIGRTVYSELQEYGLGNKVICFTVSDEKQNTNQQVDQLEVRPIDELEEYYDNTLFLIAVRDVFKDAIENKLVQLGVFNYFDARMIYIREWHSEKNKDLVEKYIKAEEGDGANLSDESDYISHVTYCVAANAGDTMLSKCVRKYLNFSNWNIINVRQKVTDDMIRKINRGRALIIGGGGLFLPDTNENNISGWQWAISEEQMDQIAVPIIVYSVGYNYFRGQIPNKQFKQSLIKLIQKAEFVGLRNGGSVREVKKIVGEELGKKIVYQPCMTTMISKIYSFENGNNSKIIGVNMAFDREKLRFGNKKRQILNEVAIACKEIQDIGYQLLYIAHTDEDLRFLKYLDYYHIQYSVENLTNEFPDKIVETYKKLQCVIGMRGHTQMIPFGAGCRIITLGTHDKMKWFLEDINMKEDYVDLTENVDDIAKNLVKIFRRSNIENYMETDIRLEAEKIRLWNVSEENKGVIMSKIFSQRHDKENLTE